MFSAQFTAALCLDVEETFHFYLLNKMQLKGYLSLKITYFTVCLKNKNRGDREGVVVGTVPPLSRMCPLSERERDGDGQAEKEAGPKLPY